MGRPLLVAQAIVITTFKDVIYIIRIVNSFNYHVHANAVLTKLHWFLFYFTKKKK